MNSSNNPKPSIIIEEVTGDENSEAKDQSSPPQFYYPNAKVPSYTPAPDALSVYNEDRAREYKNTFHAGIQQQTKTSDDSKIAYGDSFASSFGQRGLAPLPEFSPEASAPPPPYEDNDWEEYQKWMHAPTHADRLRLPQHKRWSDIINQGQGKFRLHSLEILKDSISAEFRNRAANTENNKLFTGNGNPPNYREIPDYAPSVFKAQIPQNNSGNIDQVQEMMDYSDKHFKSSYIAGKFTGQEIPSNQFYILSDHGGESSGRDLHIWGPGTKKSFTIASSEIGKNLARVDGAATSYSTTVDYAHVSNRFTIIRVNDNEMGFVLDRSNNTVKRMRPGRYVIPEKDIAYIGKTVLQPGALVVRAHADNKDNYIKQLAAQLQILMVPPGQTAFIRDNNNSYMLASRPEPYVLDQRRNEKFISFENINQQLIRAKDGSYTQINQLQPGQFVMFQHDSKTIVWHYDAKNPLFNTLYLPENQYRFDGAIHNISENHIEWQNTHVVNIKPGQTLAVRDNAQQVRFIEETQPQTLVLRTPWQFVSLISQNEVDYRTGSREAGNEIARLMLRSSEWAAVLDKTGHLAFYPPRLDNQPYYFLQPEHTVIKVINKNTMGETKLEVPGIGNVSIVNIPSGSIGACRLHNMHFFLNPSDTPYVFVPPDAFIKFIDAKQAHIQVEDLHRIVLKPDERAIISKDGKLYRLPTSNVEDSKELSEENGIHVFRSFQLEMYGPEKKSKKEYTLGPIQYFNVGVGEVAYGTLDGKLKIWEAGEHSVDNRKNEWFTKFFSTNVDPVQIDKLPVTFQHGITGSVGVYVSYLIVDSEKAIRQFRDHETLHEFISKTTQSEMIKLCASRPPLGYTDLYFSSAENKPVNESSEGDASKAVHEIEDSFMEHAAELLEQYGVRISKMYIDSWALAEDFVKQVQANAKLLQDAHAKVEQTRMSLQQSGLVNQQEIQRTEAEIRLKQNENKRMELELEAQRLRQANTSKTEADSKVAAAEAEAKITVVQATARAQIAEQDANGKNAAQRIESEIIKSVAENKLEAKRKEIEAEKLKNNTERAKGLYEAEIAAAKTRARFAGLRPEQRMQLELAQIQAKSTAGLVQVLLQEGIQVPGAVTVDPKLFKMLSVPSIMTAPQMTSGSFNNPAVLFAPPKLRSGKAARARKQVVVANDNVEADSSTRKTMT